MNIGASGWREVGELPVKGRKLGTEQSGCYSVVYVDVVDTTWMGANIKVAESKITNKTFFKKNYFYIILRLFKKILFIWF